LKKEYYPDINPAAGAILRWVEIVFLKPVARELSDSDPYFPQTLLLGSMFKIFA
jgi:hypothetical protein